MSASAMQGGHNNELPTCTQDDLGALTRNVGLMLLTR